MKQLLEKLKQYEYEYKSFMGIEAFPPYRLETKEVSLEEFGSSGVTSIATASYQTQKGIHTLGISVNLPLTKYLVFHEFTHILDAERYVKRSGERNMGLTSYMEYHASQVALMQMLGANSIDERIIFSMNDNIIVLEKQVNVYQHVEEKRKTAIDLFSSDNLLYDINTLTMAIGVLCNYWGLRSICKMYSKDYTEIIDNYAFLRTISSCDFSLLNRLMQGWLDDDSIEKSIALCVNILNPLISELRVK